MQLRHGAPSGKVGPILVIDDDDGTLQAIADLLRGAGFDVHALASPIGATQVIANHGVSAAVIDMNMPVMRGDRFIALVRSWDRIRDLPIVLVAGDQAPQNPALRRPGVAVIAKAQVPELLVSTLRQALGGASKRESMLPSAAIGTSARAPRARQETPRAGIARALPHLARSAHSAWQSFASGGGQVAGTAAIALTALQVETKVLGLTNTAAILTLALDLVEACGFAREVPAEADVALTELLLQLANSTSEKNRSFDRSLALTLLRARLDRARPTLT